MLWIRVGSDGRSPIWAKIPVNLHRAIPDNATWQWVRVSCRRENLHEHWSVEITLTIDAEPARMLDRELAGAIAVELMWVPLDDGGIRVASWLDDQGRRGTVELTAHQVGAIEKPAGIRSVRDVQRNAMQVKLGSALQRATDLPEWLRRVGGVVHLWRSAERLHHLAMRWDRQCPAVAPEAREILRAWTKRDLHLWQYESCGRSQALGRRRDMYRVIASRWSGQYRSVLLPDRDLSREARWGEDSDRRFAASPQELRQSLRHAFGEDAIDVEWRGPHGVIDTGDEDDDPPEWKEFAIERWRDAQNMGGARNGEKTSKSNGSRGGAWARRKAKAAEKRIQNEAARDASGKAAE